MDSSLIEVMGSPLCTDSFLLIYQSQSKLPPFSSHIIIIISRASRLLQLYYNLFPAIVSVVEIDPDMQILELIKIIII